MLRRAATTFPFLLLAACASTHPIQPQIAPASLDFANAEQVEVTLKNFDFVPSEVRLQAGRPYELVITNAADGGHDFTAPEFFAAAQIMESDAPLVESGQVDLEGGQSVTVHLVPAEGSYDLVCTHFGHPALGMRGSITVG
jgi:uncharacterized cupredoxin-like copper-binding protein